MDLKRLKQALAYDPDTGGLTWKTGAFKGRRAGHPNERGYLRLNFGGRVLYAHRVAFALHHDRVPTEVDHANGVRADNRAENLRECTRQQNLWNAKRKGKSPTSVHKGVHWNKQKRKWQARIGVDHRGVHLGFFADEDAAGRAYATGAARIAGEFARAS